MERLKINQATPDTQLEFPTSERGSRIFISKLSSLLTTWDAVVIVVLTFIAVLSRLWILGARVLSHDESLHAYYSWLLATGKG